MRKINRTLTKILFAGTLLTAIFFVNSCDTWMSNDDFMSEIESQVHDANASQISVYVRYANNKMGNTEPSGNTTMKVDVPSKISAVTNDDYGFVKWAAFSTTDFPTAKQHSSLTFITEEDYNTKFKEKELPASIVYFASPKSPTTEVKILSSRNDIFIIPIVAARPAYKLSVPANADSNVVKNTSIRILFSKAIDPNTLYDEEGNANYSITSSTAIFTDDDNEMEATDITDLFDAKLSDSGTMLTLKLKTVTDENNNVIKQELLDNRQRITITLLEGLCDRYGFSMNGNYTFSFQTGTNTDSLAPMIEVIYAGTGDVCDVFVTFGEDGEMKGSATAAAMSASKTNVESPEYTDAVVAQRVYDKLNIFVKANDIIASGNVDINAAKDLSEENVANVGIAASLYFDKEGKPVTLTSENVITKKNHIYISGSIDKECQIKNVFTEVVPAEFDYKENKTRLDAKGDPVKYTGGTIYTYDISSLPDGLIRIDVWGIDMTGNSGGPDDKGALYYTKHDNSFKSIFVVKDTTPIDSANVKAKKQVISNSEKAPYYWYNKNTLDTMELFDSLANKIQDSGHAKLRSLDKNLWWTFRVGKDTEEIKADDASWKRIHDEETGNESLHYQLKGAKFPAKDGPVDITLYLKDDLGNMSEPVLLDSIMYDNTAPTVSLKKGIGDFVNADGQAVLHASDDQIISQILKVDIGEANIDETGSGIRRMEIHVTKDGSEVPVPLNTRLDGTKFAVKYAPASIANPTPKSAGVIDIEIDTDDIASTDKLKVFKVGDSNKITSGTLFIYGLTFGDTDGTYEVSIDLFDSALNKTPETAKTNFARDTTDPVINKVQIAGAQSRVAYGETESTWWMPIKEQNLASLEKVSFAVDVSESGSGIKYIKLGKNIEFTSATKIKYGSTYLVEDTDYTLDVANRTIELKDWFTPILKDANAKAITLENVKLNNPDKTEGNQIAIIADDFVEKSSVEKTEFFYNDTTSGTVIYADTKKPEITTLKIEDADKKTATNPHSLGYDNRYTDSQNVTLTLKLTAESLLNGSGVKTITLSGNALFTADTAISVDGTALTSGITFAADKKSVTFEKPFVADNVLIFTNVHIVSAAEGKQTIKAFLTDFVGLENTPTESTAVTLDQVAPVITNIEWVADAGIAKGSANSNKVTDQTFKVDFKEETSGARVIKFDIDYEGDPQGTESYAKPFDLTNFKLYYGNSLEPLTKGTDYEIKNNRYLLLKEPKISSAGSFRFENLQLRDSSLEGQYNIKVTLLDQAENINIQEGSAKYSMNIFIDTTAPVVSKVQVVGASKRSVYGNQADTKQWWMPYSYFDQENDHDLNKVSFAIKVNEAGSGLKIIKLTEDVEFTAATELYAGTSKLVKGTDYVLDTENHEIVLKDFESPKLRGTPAEFTIQNIKLKKINSDAGNKVGFAVEDWVTNPGSNESKVYYPDDTEGTFIYADSEKPEIATLNIEDSAAETANNPHSIAYEKDNYTDTQLVKLTLKLQKESTKNGSGVKTVHLTQNAEFTTTGTDKTTISVNGTPLAETEYEFTGDKKSVSFAKVFTEDQTLVFTNVKILSIQDGTQTITTDLTDFVGLRTEVSTASNEITLDKTAPVISNIEWIADDANTTVGFAHNNEVKDQTLIVNFTEATSGAKIIKFDVVYNEEADSYSTPFDMSNLTIKYIDGSETKTLAAGTDYTILDADQRYIELNNNYTSGTFTFHDIKLRNVGDDEGNYTVKVTLLDAAENKGENHESITIDATNPVIDGNITIPDVSSTVPALKNVVELRTSGTGAYDGYWLDKNYVGGSGASHNANNIPLYINIKEGGSGIKVIKFLEDAILTTSTKLYYIDGANGKTELSTTKYTVSTTNNTITINTKDDANKYFSTKDGKNPADPFLIIVEGVGFKNTDVSGSSGKVSKNKIKVQVSDVAKNESNEQTTEQLEIYSDSIKPATPTSFTLSDRSADASDNTVSAFSGYTNEAIVNMTFNLGTSEQYGSGYHKFVLEGAKFKKQTETSDYTTISMANGNSSIQNFPFDISDDGRTLTLKNSDPAANTYAVVKQAVTVTIYNVHLDNATDQGQHEVKLTASDLTGWDSETATYTIILDTQGPRFDNNGPFVANYTYGDYYKPAINVYPHVSTNTESAHGIPVTYNGKTVYTVYTATTYDADKNLYHGEVSDSAATMDKAFMHKAVLGFRVTDNKLVSGYDGSIFMYYKKDDNFTLSKSQLLSNGTPLKRSSTGTTPRIAPATPSAYISSETSYALWFGFETGKYSAVTLDAAGNCSEVLHFAVVRDTDRPSTTDLNNRVLFERPGEDYNIYRNTAPAISDNNAFANGYKAGTSYTTGVNGGALRSKKFVTKKSSSNKYKIILKLGENYNPSTLITNMQGEEVSSSISTSKYTDLDGSLSNAPIEQYLISTWYGEWPSAYQTKDTHGYSYEYKPLVTNGTTFPSGQTMNCSNYLSTTDNQDVRNYFGYSSAFTSYMRVYDTGSSNTAYTKWHSYSHPADSDGTKYTENGNNITSYVDKNNNLIIELPPQSTAPVSVFLRDGCGNMSYVVCGLETDKSGEYTWYDESDTEHETPHKVSYNYQVAPSFIIDDWLGWKQTTNGVNMEPILRQNPHMNYASSSSNVSWPNWTIDSTTGGAGYKWDYNSGNGDQGGVGGTLGYIKDLVKKATYYNPNISNTSQNITSNKFKLGLTLYFKQSDEDGSTADKTEHPEDITFDTSLGKTDSTTDYSTRALLYCTQSPDRPDYDTIVKSDLCSVAHKKANGDPCEGFRTEWTAIRISSSTTSGVTLLLDYPEPDYDNLGWVVNDPATHEPIPHYMWYVYEDRVGNYEIGKVVNSSENDRAVLAGTKASTSVYDKWLFDGKKPEVTVFGTNGTKPDNIGSDKLNELISDNNGYVPYLQGTNTVWVSSDPSRGSRSGIPIKAPASTTWGVTNKVENDSTGQLVPERAYLPFANLTLSKEITGIRAFCWSTSLTAPAYTNCAHTNNTQGDGSATGKWYPGSGVKSMLANIGESHSYTNSTNKYLQTSTYTDKYTGTKINEVLPYEIINKKSGCALYLHVMDWTGNVASYRMGSNFVFKNDITGPSQVSSSTATKTVKNDYYVDNTYVRIAGNGNGSADKTKTMQIEFPTDNFTDSSGSGIKGYVLKTDSLTNPVVGNISGNYLEIDYDIYSHWGDGTLIEFYGLDNVGNVGELQLTGIYDTTPPAVSAIYLVTKESSETVFADTQTVYNTTNDVLLSGYGYSHDFTKPAEYHADTTIPATELQEIWINKSGAAKFHIKLSSNPGDFDNINIYRWNGTWGESITSYKTSSNTVSTNWQAADNTNRCLDYYMEEYGYLTASEAGTYYQIEVLDKSGNATYRYFKIYLDDKAPVLKKDTNGNTIKPAITLGKGSINPVGTDYYYTADASHPLKLNFALTDAGVGSNSAFKKFKYSLNGTDWLPADETDGSGIITKYNYIANPSNVEIPITGGDIETLYFKDIFGNATKATETSDPSKPGFTYTYTNGDGVTDTKSISKLNFYGDNAPATPVIKKVKQNDGTELEWFATWKPGDGETWYINYNRWLNTDTVLITSQDRQKFQIQFDKPETVIGYLITDEKGNVVPETEYKKEKDGNNNDIYVQYLKENSVVSKQYKDVKDWYSSASLDEGFTENLPMVKDGRLNSDYDYVTRKYYAVDVVGNISTTPLTIKYSYDDPTRAKNITLIESTDAITDKDGELDTGVLELMKKDDLVTKVEKVENGVTKYIYSPKKFAKFAKKKGKNNDKNGNIYFNDDFIVLRCTLLEKAVEGYNERPVKVNLYDVYTWAGNLYQTPRGSSAVSTDNDYNDMFKVYPSDKQDADGNYYCYIAFKINGSFDNNTSSGGSVIYAKIYGKTQAESDYEYLNAQGITKDKKYGWQMDTTGPEFDSNVYNVNNSNVLKDYKTEGTWEKVYDRANNEKIDYATVAYESGMKIGIQKIKDSGAGAAAYKFEIVNGSTTPSTTTYDGPHPLVTEKIGVTDYYVFTLPDITTVHTSLNLYLIDKVGNVSSKYVVASPNDTGDKWWILNDILKNAPNTEENPIRVTAKKEYTEAGPYPFLIEPPAGSIIRTIKVHLEGPDGNHTKESEDMPTNDFKEKVNGQDVYYKRVDFVDYQDNNLLASGGKWSEGTKLSDNTIKGWVNINGFDFKVRSATKLWLPQTVVLTINDGMADKKVVKVKDWVPAFSLDLSKITWGNVSWDPVKSRYELPLTLPTEVIKNKQGEITQTLYATEDNICYELVKDDTFLSNVELSIETPDPTKSNEVKIVISGVPSVKDWNEHSISIKVWDKYDPNPNPTTVTKEVLKINPIGASDIDIKLVGAGNTETELNWDNVTTYGEGRTKTFNIRIKTPGNATISKLSATTDSDVNNVSLDWTSGNEAKITANPNWTETKVTFIINGDENNENGLTKTEYFTVPAITKDDFDITIDKDWNDETVDVDDDGKKTLPLTFTHPAKISDLNPNNTNVEPGELGNSQEGMTLRVSQSWDKITSVKFTINGVEKPVAYTIPAKLLGDGDIEVSAGSWNSENTEYTFSLDFPENNSMKASMSNVKSVSLENPDLATLTPIEENPGTYKLTGFAEKTWNEQPINLIIKNTADTALTAMRVIAIQPKSLSKNDIISVGAETLPEWDGTSQSYEVAVSLVEGVPVTALTDVSATEGVTAEFNEGKTKIVLKGMQKGWSEKTVKVKINNSEDLTYDVLKILKKSIGKDDVTITRATNNSTDGKWYYCELTITLPLEVTIDTDGVTSLTHDVTVGEETKTVNYVKTITVRKDENVTDKNVYIVGLQPDGELSTGEIIQIKTSHGTFKVTAITGDENSGSPSTNLNLRTLGGRLTSFVKELVSGNSDAKTEKHVSAYSYSDPSTIFEEPVSVLARDIADVLAEQEKAAKKEAKKNAKLAKKAAKAAQPAELPAKQALPVNDASELAPVVDEIAASKAASAEKVAADVLAPAAESGVEQKAAAHLNSPLASAEVEEGNANHALLWSMIVILTAALVIVAAMFYKKYRRK